MSDSDDSSVTIEFLGIPRRRAGLPELQVQAKTVREALEQMVALCPSLKEVIRGEILAPEYLLSLDGERFLRDLDHPLQPRDRLLLLSADVGG